MQQRINCANCDGFQFVDIPLNELHIDASEKEIDFEKIKKIPVGGIICCARCNNPLSEGPIKKGKVEVHIVEDDIDKIKLAIQFHKKYSADAFFLLKNKKEMMNLQASIGNSCKSGTVSLIESFSSDMSVSNIFSTVLIPYKYFEYPKNYHICLTRQEYDQETMIESTLQAQLGNGFVVNIHDEG